MPIPPSIPPEDDPIHFDAAIRHFRARVPMTDAAFEQLDARAKRKAFAVAGAAELDLVADVWLAVDRAIAEGETLDDFRARVGADLEEAWGGAEPWHLEAIFRTNVQNSYSAGRWRQQRDPAVMKVRPFWKYSAVLDSRTTDICAELNGTTLPADDEFWLEHNPPAHFSCRSSIIALTEEQADPDEEGPDVDADEGFGLAPGEDEWDGPDLRGYPEPLRAIFDEK